MDKALSKRFERWVLEDGRSGNRASDAFAAVFGNGSRVLRSPNERAALFEFLLFDWRPAPDGPTLAEQRLTNDRFRSTYERALAQATAAARPAIYRVGVPRRGIDLPMTPLFPPGPPVILNDRQLSLTCEPGWLFGARIYLAGSYLFGRLLGDAVSPDRESHLLRALSRDLRDFIRSGGLDDPVTLVHARPQVLIRALRARHG